MYGQKVKNLPDGVSLWGMPDRSNAAERYAPQTHTPGRSHFSATSTYSSVAARLEVPRFRMNEGI